MRSHFTVLSVAEAEKKHPFVILLFHNYMDFTTTSVSFRQVLHKRLPSTAHEQSVFVTAVENTWVHGRQKRRDQKRQLRELPRAPHSAGAVNPSSQIQTASSPQINTIQGDADQNDTTPSQEPVQQQPEENQADKGSNTTVTIKDITVADQEKEGPKDAKGDDVDMEATNPTEAPAAAPRPPSPTAVQHFLFKCLLNVMLEGSDVMIEIHWVEGHNKDLMNQLCTFLKNTLLKSVARPWKK